MRCAKSLSVNTLEMKKGFIGFKPSPGQSNDDRRATGTRMGGNRKLRLLDSIVDIPVLTGRILDGWARMIGGAEKRSFVPARRYRQ